LPDKYAALEFFAKRSSLAYVQGPHHRHMLSNEAAELLKKLAWGKKLFANFVYSEGEKSYVLLNEQAKKEPKDSVNFFMLTKGMVKLDKDIELPEALAPDWQKVE